MQISAIGAASPLYSYSPASQVSEEARETSSGPAEEAREASSIAKPAELARGLGSNIDLLA